MRRMWTPNLIVVCVDNVDNEAYQGRIYHLYRNQPIYFANILQMIKWMEAFYNELEFPKSSTKDRYFVKKMYPMLQGGKRVLSKNQIMKQKGKQGTFLVRVQYRQNATWQGQITWVEGQETKSFRSVLEMLKLMDNVIDIEEERKGEAIGYEEE